MTTTITVDINDSEAGGTYEQTFEQAYAGTTEDGTPVYIYVPEGALGGVGGRRQPRPGVRPDPR